MEDKQTWQQRPLRQIFKISWIKVKLFLLWIQKNLILWMQEKCCGWRAYFRHKPPAGKDKEFQRGLIEIFKISKMFKLFMLKFFVSQKWERLAQTIKSPERKVSIIDNGIYLIGDWFTVPPRLSKVFNLSAVWLDPLLRPYSNGVLFGCRSFARPYIINTVVV